MGQTDRQTDKSSRWAFTAFEDQWSLFTIMPDIIAEWGWQEEVCATTARKHYQGYLRTKRQVRFSQLAKSLPKVHLEIAKDWNKLLSYCNKTDTAVEGTQQHQVSSTPSMSMADALIMLANNLSDLEPLTLEQMTDDAIAKRSVFEYWQSVTKILMDNPNMVGLFTQPQYLRAWSNTRAVWVHHAKLKAESIVYEEPLQSPPASSPPQDQGEESPREELSFQNDIIARVCD